VECLLWRTHVRAVEEAESAEEEAEAADAVADETARQRNWKRRW
jgi:hypothetical protein